MAWNKMSRPHEPDQSMYDSVDVMATALAQNDMDTLERSYGHQHGLLSRVVFHTAALDPRCCTTSALPVALSIALSFLLTGIWQISAIYIAARFELGLTNTVGILATGVAVAVLVVSFDWDIVHKRIRGETRAPMLAVRFVFVIVMALLVSEAVSGWVFDRDISRQIATENDSRRQQHSLRLTTDDVQLRALNARLVPLTQAVSDARKDLADAQAEMTRQERGLKDARDGRGKLWEAARLDRDKAVQELARAQETLKSQGGPISAERDRILEAQAVFIASRPIVDPKELGPGERERALWTYLLEHPEALWLRRVPLALVLIVLDLFAVIIGWSVSSSLRDRHREWARQLATLRDRAHRLRNAVLDSSEERLYAALDADRRQPGPAPGVPGPARRDPMTPGSATPRVPRPHDAPTAYPLPDPAPDLPTWSRPTEVISPDHVVTTPMDGPGIDISDAALNGDRDNGSTPVTWGHHDPPRPDRRP